MSSERVATSDDPIVVIGSGPCGSVAAARLVERGVDVVMLDSGQHAPRGLVIRAAGNTLYRKINWSRYCSFDRHTNAAEDVWRGLVAQVIIACLDTTDAKAKDYLEAAKDLGAFLGSAFIDLFSGVKLSAGLPGGTKATIDLKALKTIKEEAKDFLRPFV